VVVAGVVRGAAPVALRHEEHDTLAVEPGAYRVVRQREYTRNDEDVDWRLVGD
jgi:hypothetical protein